MSTHSNLGTLLEMLTYMRPAGSVAEREFCARFLKPLGAAQDTAGNWHLRVDDTPVLWSAHTDTVHRHSGRQTLDYQKGSVRVSKRSRKRGSNCLGADDTAGVFLLWAMAQRNVPGYYIWHYGEERGGIGSRALADHYADWLLQFKCAIALDRAHTTDVITQQAGGRCCSDAFARSLADALGLDYKPCTNGIYTDTAEYIDIIPECTNLSVGYEHAHHSSEVLDCSHVLTLLEALCELDTTALVIERDPFAVDPRATVLDWDDRDYYLTAEQAETQRSLREWLRSLNPKGMAN